jgi:lipopolysaccharide/colanic/teichoic acid biosynthesis glycosyltransferase
VFFVQDRRGFRGGTFAIWKLRTMDARPGQQGPHYTEDTDSRVTRVGRVLRHYRIDELPQIWNVLRRDMSWIGPRPEALPLSAWYERELPLYVYRHVVRPGVTGWAQVNQGNVSRLDGARTKLEYDFFYIKHLSFWLDAVIFIKTLRTVLTGFGSR